MAQVIDVTVKTVFLHPGDGIIRRRLFRGQVEEYLSVEQPQVSNKRADMVARNSDGEIHHVEFQASNEAGFGLRMLGYYYYFLCTQETHVAQTVLYMGREPLRLENTVKTPTLDFRFEIVDLREYDAETLLAARNWADVLLALLAKGDPERALAVAIERLRAMGHEERAWAMGTLLVLSGILGIEESANERLKEFDVINVMENKVLGPLILRELEKGWNEGRQAGVQEGMQQGMQEVITELLTEKFGALPAWANTRLESASSEELHRWAKRVLHCASLEDTLR